MSSVSRSLRSVSMFVSLFPMLGPALPGQDRGDPFQECVFSVEEVESGSECHGTLVDCSEGGTSVTVDIQRVPVTIGGRGGGAARAHGAEGRR